MGKCPLKGDHTYDIMTGAHRTDRYKKAQAGLYAPVVISYILSVLGGHPPIYPLTPFYCVLRRCLPTLDLNPGESNIKPRGDKWADAYPPKADSMYDIAT